MGSIQVINQIESMARLALGLPRKKIVSRYGKFALYESYSLQNTPFLFVLATWFIDDDSTGCNARMSYTSI